jgi:putative tryptophan/tyrosine transport system substrate-binding protein
MCHADDWARARVMNRRTFLYGLTLATVVAPLTAEGQQAGKLWRIGLLANFETPSWEVFLHELRGLGWAEGKNIVTERLNRTRSSWTPSRLR